MKRIYNVGEISISGDLGLWIDWDIYEDIPRPEINNDVLIRSPLFYFAGGNRYFSALLSFEEDSVILIGMSITYCRRDMRDFQCFIFGAYGNDGIKILLRSFPFAHGGGFAPSSFIRKKSRLISYSGIYHFFCKTVPTPYGNELDSEKSIMRRMSRILYNYFPVIVGLSGMIVIIFFIDKAPRK